MAIISGIGVAINGVFAPASGDRLDAWWFGEAASRVIVACNDENADLIVQRCEASRPSMRAIIVGRTGGNEIQLGSHVSVNLDHAIDRYESALTAQF
jgi:hypothetical protein